MPQVKPYTVKLTPATVEHHDTGFTSVTFKVFDPNAVNHTIEASSVQQIENKVRQLAKEFGRTCSVYVAPAAKSQRKPPGFDAAMRKLQTIEFAQAA